MSTVDRCGELECGQQQEAPNLHCWCILAAIRFHVYMEVAAAAAARHSLVTIIGQLAG